MELNESDGFWEAHLSLKMSRNFEGHMSSDGKGMELLVQIMIMSLQICYSIADGVSHLFMHTPNLPLLLLLVYLHIFRCQCHHHQFGEKKIPTEIRELCQCAPSEVSRWLGS